MRVSVLAAVFSVVCAVSSAFAADEFAVLPGGSASTFSAMTPDGRAAIGTYTLGNARRPFWWDGRTFIDLQGAYSSASASGISADGSIVVGEIFDGNGRRVAVKWVDGVPLFLTGLGNSGGEFALAVSADGRVIVGGYHDLTLLKHRAYVWTDGVGMADRQAISFGGLASTASAISGNGRVVIGTADISTTVSHAFRWDGAMIDLTPNAPGTTFANYVSYNGDVVVGSINNESFRWTTANPTAEMLTAFGKPIEVKQMTPDGSVVVGQYSPVLYPMAVRWTEAGATDLGTLGIASVAYSVSGNGKVVFGLNVFNGNIAKAFRWTEELGMQNLADVLAAGGVDMLGWDIITVDRASEDGSTFIGNVARNNDYSNFVAYFARCQLSCALLNEADAARSIASVGAVGATTSLYLGSELAAASDMASSAAASGAPVTGFAYGAYDSDPTTSASAGFTWNLGGDLLAGGTVGVAGIVTDMPNGGSASFSGPSVTGFLASRPDTGLNWTLGASVTGLSGSIKRGYLNGNTPVTSSGDTTGSGFAVSAEMGWTFDDLLADVLVTPFVNVTVSSASYAGYSETGGPFPAAFSSFSTSSALVKIGVDGRYAFADDAWLNGSLAYGKNIANGGTISASIPGAMALGAPGATLPGDFLEASVGVDLPIHDSLRFSGRLALTAPFSGPASVQARAGFTMSF